MDDITKSMLIPIEYKYKLTKMIQFLVKRETQFFTSMGVGKERDDNGRRK